MQTKPRDGRFYPYPLLNYCGRGVMDTLCVYNVEGIYTIRPKTYAPILIVYVLRARAGVLIVVLYACGRVSTYKPQDKPRT